MASKGPRAGLALACMLAAALAGCGGGGGVSDEDARQFARDADEICEDARGKAERGGQPRTLGVLAQRASAAHVALRDGARRLHELRDDLGDDVPATIATFDAKVDGVVATTRKLARDADADFGNGVAVRSTAQRLRKRSAVLYKAARAAGMKQCGRGGNRAADRALFVTYREDWSRISDDYLLGTTRLYPQLGSPSGLADYELHYRRLLREIVSYRRGLASLVPPRNLKPAHRQIQRTTTALLLSARRFLAAVQRGVAARALAEVYAAQRPLLRDGTRFDRAAARMRRLLNGGSKSTGAADIRRVQAAGSANSRS